MKPPEVFIANHKASKQTKQQRHSHNKTFDLFNFVLLLIQRRTIQLQQSGADAHRQVVRIHLVGIGALEDVMEDADQMLQEDFIGPR